jgi:alpha-glucosidase
MQRCKPADTVELSSPNEQYRFELLTGDSLLRYRVTFRGKEIISASALGFDLAGKGMFPVAVDIRQLETREVDTLWTPLYGERSQYPERYREAIFSLLPVETQSTGLNLIVRAYNEGIAFRYQFETTGSTIIERERTQFRLPPGSEVWVTNSAQGVITKQSIDALGDQPVERPLLAEVNDTLFVALGEAALVDFARMKFAPDSSRIALQSHLAGEVQFDGPFISPWRYVMAGATPGEILEHNYLLLNLNEPDQIENTDWIRPGKVIREVTLTTQGGMACVDFATAHNLQYIEFDAGWYGREYDESSDATTVTVDPGRSKGPLDLHRVIDYASSKGVGVWLYINRRALEKQLEEILPLAKSWGVAGLKYGFVQVGQQEWTQWLHGAVCKAAQHQLMIAIHDEYRPTGYSRTYPNLMTQEGIRGDEESPDNAMVLKTLFTRMIAGAGDHTNCYFAERVEEKMGSHASQLAKTVCIYSPIQFLYWYDRPPGSPGRTGGAGSSQMFIREVPELAFFDQVPTVWDDTRVLQGYPGEYAVVARKSGSSWFVGALNGEQAREFVVPLGFLDAGSAYEAVLFADDPTVNTITHVAIDTLEVTATDVISRQVGSQEGMAVILKRQR